MSDRPSSQDVNADNDRAKQAALDRAASIAAAAVESAAQAKRQEAAENARVAAGRGL